MKIGDKKKPEIQMQAECDSAVYFQIKNGRNSTSQLGKKTFLAPRLAKDLTRAVCAVLTSTFLKWCKELKSRKEVPDRLYWLEHGLSWNLVEREKTKGWFHCLQKSWRIWVLIILLLHSTLKQRNELMLQQEMLVMPKEELLDQMLGQGSAEMSDPVIFLW